MQFIILKLVFPLFVSLIFTLSVFSQSDLSSISGKITDQEGVPVSFASVSIDSLNLSTTTDSSGFFTLKNIPTGTHLVTVSNMGYAKQKKIISLKEKSNSKLHFKLKEDVLTLDEVVVFQKSEAQKIEETGFSVESVETKELQTQSVQLNRVLDRTAGVRVRQQGGMGSNYNYSLDGMSGNAVKFFIDGIPMEYFGSSYTINNLPVSLIKRIDVYKGVVPVELGSDALGGAINVVSDNRNRNYLEMSYGYGSFNSNQAALHGRYTHARSNFTTRLSSFYTYSDNNYKVWGTGVNYADASTGFRAIDFTKENPAIRFNDQFQTINGKVDIGFVEKKWADQFFISLLASTQNKGIQNGQTMATVYGKLHYKEVLFMPHLSYQKENLFTKGLNLHLFSGYTKREGQTIDTSMSLYNWKGEPRSHQQGGGEIGRDGQSLYTLYEQSWITRANITYQLPGNFKLGFNYFNSGTERRGEDPYAAAYRVPHVAPQSINRQFAGLSLETKKWNEKLYVNTFVKWYDFKSTANVLEYYLINNQYHATAVPIKNNKSNWGGGMATSYKIHRLFLTKFSIEQATRLPTPTEALGDGVLVRNNPNIKPEQSLNLNLGFVWGRIPIGKLHGLKITANVFFRDTKDQLLYKIAKDDGIYENVRMTRTKGIGMELVYDLNYWLKVNANMTYMDIRNNQRMDNGVANILYGDRLRNTPYLLGNAGVSAHIPNVILKHAKLFTYIHANYLHEFYLFWPSLGDKNTKSMIPSQLVFDFGIGYTFPKQNMSVAFDLSNFTNTQVYDNYLLQKPGRAAFIKIKYQIKPINKS
jgi:outer membrane receptor protein involved in Fe transport